MAAEDLDEFKIARERAQQESAARMQQRKDALTRRFAQLGNLSSGARMKQEQLATQEESSNLSNANQQIDAAERAELRRRREIGEERAFQSGEAEKSRLFSRGERIGSQDFAGQQAALGRAFATSERLGGQEFAAGQAGEQRKYLTGERESSQRYATAERQDAEKGAIAEAQRARDFAGSEAEKQRGLAQQQIDQAIAQFNEARIQWDKTFAHEVYVDEANLKLADKIANEKGLLEGLGSQITSWGNPFGGGGSSGSKGGAILGALGGLSTAGPIGAAVGFESGKKLGGLF